MLRIFNKKKETCIVLNEDEKIKIMSSKNESDNLIIKNQKGVFTIKKQKYKKYRNVVGLLIIGFMTLCLTGCGNDTCEEWEKVEKINCSKYSDSATKHLCQERNKDAGKTKCVKWK